MISAPHRLYGRRKGKALRARKRGLMETLLPQIAFALPEAGAFDPAGLFPFRPENLWLEVGFGGGEHLAAQAVRQPQTGMIGCEFFLNGIAGLLDHIDQEKLRNIRIFPEDARRLLRALPEACLDRVYVLFADPWPKKRHAARRFIQHETLLLLARAMPPEAELWLASDDPVLQGWMRERLAEAAALFQSMQTDLTSRPAGWIPTRYEEKAIQAGRQPLYFRLRRTSAASIMPTTG